MTVLEGKIAIVTGGGRGIGRGITECFLAAGASVLVAQRADLTAELAGKNRLQSIRADLSDPTAPAEIVAQAVTRFGGLDILVNNAGIMFETSVAETSQEDWSKMLAVNLTAPFLLAKAAVAPMAARSGGAIVNIGSIEGLGANPGHTAYCATKAGLHGMTRALAVDLGRHGIRCNAVAPGCIETDLVAEWLRDLEDPATFERDFLAMHPIGRLGRPEDIGALAVFLASAQAGFLTGQVFVADGGRMAKLPTPTGL